MRKYLRRCQEANLARLLSAFPAVLIEGPKGCGKSTLGEQRAKSAVYLQDPDERKRASALIDIGQSKRILEGEKPRLIDEWQDFPDIWDSIRYNSDRTGGESGQFILTGSSVPRDNKKPAHSGAGRFARLRLRTMSLFESGESTAEVSLKSLFDIYGAIEGTSRLTLEDIAFVTVRGGWPLAVLSEKSGENAGLYARQYVETVVNEDLSRESGGHRSPSKVRSLMHSLARATAASSSISKLKADMAMNISADEDTISDYISALKRVFVVENLPAWSMKLRSRTAIRTAEVRHFSDPSIAASLLGAGEGDLLNDPETFGLFFESLVIRDLRVYAEAFGASVSHYRDKNGLEADAIIHLPNGRWGAVEAKLGQSWTGEAVKHLLTLSDIACEKPAFLLVVIPEGCAYTTKEGVHVCPLGCLAP